MKTILGIICFTVTAAVCGCKYCPSGGGGSCDSNAIVFSYLKKHHLLESRSILPKIRRGSKFLPKWDSREDIKGLNVEHDIVFEQVPGYGNSGTRELQGEDYSDVPSADTATLSKYTVPIDESLAQQMVNAFYNHYGQYSLVEKNAFFMKVSDLKQYFNTNPNITDLELIPALFKDQYVSQLRRTFIMLPVAARHQLSALNASNMVYEHMLPCPDECGQSDNAIVRVNDH